MDMQVEPAQSFDAFNGNIEEKSGRARSLANLRPAKPGECRNPRGRPKKDYNLAALAQKHAEAAINTLVEVMTNTEATPSARVGAAAEILDRGFGKAPQSLDVDHKHSFSEEFEAFVRQLSTRRQEKVIEHVESDSNESR